MLNLNHSASQIDCPRYSVLIMQIQLAFWNWEEQWLWNTERKHLKCLLRGEMTSNSFKGGVKSMEETTAKEAAMGNCDFKHMAAHCTVLEAGKNPRLFHPCYVFVKTKNDRQAKLTTLWKPSFLQSHTHHTATLLLLWCRGEHLHRLIPHCITSSGPIQGETK